MKILIACEFSATVRSAFAARGHDAWSCDLLPTEIPGKHLQCDVLTVLNKGWDMMIAHPPCTFLSNMGAKHLHRGGLLDYGRIEDGMVAFNFFIELMNAPIEKNLH